MEGGFNTPTARMVTSWHIKQTTKNVDQEHVAFMSNSKSWFIFIEISGYSGLYAIKHYVWYKLISLYEIRNSENVSLFHNPRHLVFNLWEYTSLVFWSDAIPSLSGFLRALSLSKSSYSRVFTTPQTEKLSPLHCQFHT